MNRLKKEIMASAVDELVSDGSQSVTRCYNFSKNFAGFSGHFPGNPILPAIVQLLTVVTLVEEKSGKLQRLLSVEDAKFLSPVIPDQNIVVTCRQRTVGGKLLHDARLTTDDKLIATFLIQLESQGEQP